MGATITLLPSNAKFRLEGKDTLLESGRSRGLALQHGCANGTCGLCKARIVSGEVETVRFSDYVLRENEKAEGYVLLCATTAVTDLIVEARLAGQVDEIAHQEIVAKVGKVERTGDITILWVRTPRSRVLSFLAGQYVSLDTGTTGTIELSLANCPCDGLNLEFHLPAEQLDASLQAFVDTVKKGTPVIVRGPKGKFVLDEDDVKPAVFIASGTGFAPIKSLIEHAMNLEFRAPMHLYWHVPGIQQPYAHNLCRSWADALDNFGYQWFAAPAGGQRWADELDAWFHSGSPCLDDCTIYVSGSGEFVAATGRVLERHWKSDFRCSELEASR